jgi:hypothetical protein
VDLGYHRRPFANGAPYALHRAGAHVADREHARNVRLQRERDIMPGRDEALVIDRDVLVLQLAGARLSAEKKENVAMGRQCGSPLRVRQATDSTPASCEPTSPASSVCVRSSSALLLY